MSKKRKMLFKVKDSVRCINVMGIPNTATFEVIKIHNGENHGNLVARKKGLTVHINNVGTVNLIKVEVRLKEKCKHLEKGATFTLPERSLYKV